MNDDELRVADLTADFSDDASTFGDRIAVARDSIGMTPQQLARRLGNKLQMLAGMLNVSIIWLMSGAGEGPATGLAESAGDGESDLDLLLAEMREIRLAQTTLSARFGKLEKRMRALRQ